MTTNIDKEREAFEVWARSNGYKTDYLQGSTGRYASPGTIRAWKAWKARAQHGNGVTKQELKSLLKEICDQASLKDHYQEWDKAESMLAALIAKSGE